MNELTWSDFQDILLNKQLKEQRLYIRCYFGAIRWRNNRTYTYMLIFAKRNPVKVNQKLKGLVTYNGE